MCERFDLIPPHGIESVEKVLQHRLTKHEVNKWKYGMSWSKILSSLKKHLLEFEKGNDFDENGLLNIAYVAESALILAEYYDIYPHGDDRVVGIVDRPIIALDIDDVVLDFKSAFEKRFGKLNEYWDGSYEISDDLNKIKIGDGTTKINDLKFTTVNPSEIELVDLATVATTGSYNDLIDKPTIPSVGNGTLTIQKNGTIVDTFAANATANKTINITVPTKLSDLTDDVINGKYLPLTGGTMAGNININNKTITNLKTPTADTEAANKKYVDD